MTIGSATEGDLDDAVDDTNGIGRRRLDGRALQDGAASDVELGGVAGTDNSVAVELAFGQ